MIEKPQAARANGQEDLLEQIFAQGLEKIKSPEQASAGSEPPGTEVAATQNDEGSGGAAAPKIRTSAVYLYLLVLFGAAFLMLLLAYFIQQRSSEHTISDLRDSMNLSRADLLDQISTLEGQNTALSAEVDRLNGTLTLWQELIDDLVRERTELQNQNDAAQEELYSWASFWMLEQYYQLENYEACAAVLLMQEQGQYPYRAPDRVRQAEIIRAVVDEDILDEEYAQHLEDYQYLLTAYSQP